MSAITFTAIRPSTAQEPPKPDKEGYYELLSGAFNAYNESGQYYPMTEKLNSLFREDSVLIRKMRKGHLYGEMGHPKYSSKIYASMDDYIKRLSNIEETRQALHIKEIKLVPEKNNRIHVYLKLKPYGPYGQTVKECLETPSMNCALSIRSLVYEKIINGIVHKYIQAITTWDFVSEPGIASANKWTTQNKKAGMEQFMDTIYEHRLDLSNPCVRDSLGNCILNLDKEIGLENDDSYMTSHFNTVLKSISEENKSNILYNW